MHDSPHRLALALLLVAGCSTLALSLAAAAGLEPVRPADVLLVPLAWHRHLLAAMIGVGLLVAVFVPRARFAAAAVAIADKGSFLAVSLAAGGSLDARQGLDAALLVPLVAAVAMLAYSARREARWEGVLPWRLEA